MSLSRAARRVVQSALQGASCRHAPQSHPPLPLSHRTAPHPSHSLQSRLVHCEPATRHLESASGAASRGVSTWGLGARGAAGVLCSALVSRGANGARSSLRGYLGESSIPLSAPRSPHAWAWACVSQKMRLRSACPEGPLPQHLSWNPLRVPPSSTSGVRRHASSSASATSAAAAAVASTAGAVARATAAASTSPLVTGTVGMQRAVAGWIFGCAAWTFAMVVLGGVTRLTRSGLSMTEWKFTGERPPLTQEDWQREFERYRQFPEFMRVNQGMSVEEFKYIYWMEYAHRMWGRALGVLFAVPFTVFLAQRCLSRPLISRLLLLFGLGGAQGLVGWWMVKSGLQEPADDHKEPRVSPYRLAAHLTSAFLIYSMLLWTGLTVALPLPPAETARQVAAAAHARVMAHPVAALVGVTAVSGAFVAGNDAGRAYNTFPMMGDHWIPPLQELLPLSPLHRNFFESTAMVQLQHRVLALSTLGAVSALFLGTAKLPLHPATKFMVSTALGVTALQVTLGVSTLLSYVPVSLGSAHQAGALTLFTVLLMLLHTLRRPKAMKASVNNVTLASQHLESVATARSIN